MADLLTLPGAGAAFWRRIVAFHICLLLTPESGLQAAAVFPHPAAPHRAVLVQPEMECGRFFVATRVRRLAAGVFKA